MADFLTALHARLTADGDVSALINTRAYPTIVPQNATKPYIRYQVISDDRPEHLGGYDGARVSRVQVDCFAEKFSQTRALAEAVIDAVAQPATVAGTKFGRTKAEGPRDLGEDTSDGFVHRASLDLLVEHMPA